MASNFGQYIKEVSEPAETPLKKVGKASKGVLKKGGKLLLGPGATLLGAYEAEKALSEGKSIPQAIARPLGLEDVYDFLVEEYRLPKEAADIQRRMRREKNIENEELAGFGLMSMQPVEPVTEQESRTVEQEKAKLKGIIATEEGARKEAYDKLKQDIKFRLGLEDGGPVDPKRRTILKGIAALGAIPILGPKIFTPAAKGIKAAAPLVEKGVSEAQAIFSKLVSNVVMKGKMEPGKKGITKYQHKGVEVEDNPTETIARFKTDKGADAEVIYKKPMMDEDGTRIPGDFEEYQQVTKKLGDDVDLDFEEEIIDSIEDVKKIISE